MFLLIAFFDKSQQLVEYHCQNTQDDNAEHDVIQSEDLTAVDNEIAETGVGRQKFADNDTHQAETDVDLQVADDGGDTGREDDMSQDIFTSTAQSFNQQQFIAVNVDKSGVKVDNRAENSHGDAADNNGFHIISQPDNENRGQGCLWQAVQNHEIGFKNICGAVAPPEQHGNQGAENQNEDKTDKGFADGNADMVKETFVCGHLRHDFQNPCRAAENEIVNQMAPGGNFPSA